jgi:pimeloyl-ACP methyl ester carboxylesterase
MREQLAINLVAAVRRQGADDTYADADDASWRDVEWAALRRRIEVAGRGVNVLDTGGDGPVLLWIHGLSANWQSWLLNIPQFMGSYRCVALDLPGFGLSEMPADEISITGYASAVDAVCDALGIEVVSVIGNSMGGFIGAELALSFPSTSGASRCLPWGACSRPARRASPPTRTCWCGVGACAASRSRARSGTPSGSRCR